MKKYTKPDIEDVNYWVVLEDGSYYPNETWGFGHEYLGGDITKVVKSMLEELTRKMVEEDEKV